MIDASVALIAALFGFYGLTSAIEYGIVFKILADDKNAKNMFTPLWELTNVFLVFGFTALAILFNGALGRLSQMLMPTLTVAITLMLLRACAVLAIFYIKTDSRPPAWLTWFFGLATIATPLIFTSVGVYMVCGDYFWHSFLGWLLMGSAAVGLSATGLLIINRGATSLVRLPGELLFTVWLLLIGCVLPLSVLHTANFLDNKPLLVLPVMAAVGLAVGMADYIKRVFVEAWHVAALFSVVIPVVLAWSLRPYLVAGKIDLNSAYGAQSYGSVVVIGLVIMLPLIVVGLVVFAKLFGALNSPPAKNR